MQSHDGLINILPAIPDVWKSGEVNGLKARGGFLVDIAWSNGKITKLSITSNLGGNCRIGIPNAIKSTTKTKLVSAMGSNSNAFFSAINPLITEAKMVQDGFNAYDFATEAGKTYQFIGK